MPKISIIVPIYNSENTLKKCLDSITMQSYTNTEIILVNDGSYDQSLKIIKKYVFFKTATGKCTVKLHSIC